MGCNFDWKLTVMSKSRCKTDKVMMSIVLERDEEHLWLCGDLRGYGDDNSRDTD